jgi:hypothetical protein
MGDEEIDALVAANPNTPKKTLYRLWLSHPLRALENPILLYWSLREGRPAWDLLPMEVKVALYVALRKSGCARSLEEHLPESERCGWFDSTASGDALYALAGSAGSTRRTSEMQAGAGMAAVEEGITGACEALAGDPSEAVRRCLAGALDAIPLSPVERSEVQRRLALDACPVVRRNLASSGHLDRALHLQLSTDPALEVRRALATNALVAGGVGHEGWHNLVESGLTTEVAGNRSCPETVKVRLVSSDSPRDRHLAWAGLRFHELPERRAILAEVEKVFAEPGRLRELVELAKNPSIGGTLKGRLIAHPDVRVTRAVATQKHLTEQQRVTLLFHADAKTALRAAKHAAAADFLDVAAVHPNPLVRALLAKKKGEKTWSLRMKLVEDPDPRVRAALCRGLLEGVSEFSRSHGLVAAVLKKYRKDPCRKVRQIARSDARFGGKGVFDELFGLVTNTLFGGSRSQKK